MIDITNRPLVTPDQAIQILRKHNKRGGLFADLDRCLDYRTAIIPEFYEQKKICQKLIGDHALHIQDKAAFIRDMTTKFHVPEHLFYWKGSKSANRKVLENILGEDDIDEEIKNIIREYRDWGICYYLLTNALPQYINAPLSTVESYEGHRMVRCEPIWGELATGRLGASKPSLQNMTELVSDIFTVPAGFVMLRADAGQIEPRIIYSHYVKDPLIKYLIELYNDAYYGMLHYALMTDDEDRRARSDFSTIKEIERDEKKRKQLKTLGNAGNYGKADLKEVDPLLASQFQRRIVKHPLRVEWEKEARERVYSGEESCYTAFGRKITPTDENCAYVKGSNKPWLNHLVRCFINNPVQGTAGDLFNMGIAEADHILETRSYMGSSIIYGKHDELAFMVHESEFEDLKDDLAGCTSYHKDGWIDIHSEAEIGVQGGTKRWLEYKTKAEGIN